LISLFKGVIAPSNEKYLQLTFHRAADARKRSAGLKQRRTPMFVRLSTLEHYDFIEKIDLVLKTRVYLQRQTCNDHLIATATAIGPRSSQP
jgi:hypothetical protein